MLENLAWVLWKRKARKVPEEKRGTCALCGDPVFPGDFIAVTMEEEPVHAGFHFSLEEKDAFCETGAVGSAVWGEDGKPHPLGPSAVSVAAETGKVVSSNGRSHIVHD